MTYNQDNCGSNPHTWTIMTNPRLIKLAQLEGSLLFKRYIETDAIHELCKDGEECLAIKGEFNLLEDTFIAKVVSLAKKMNLELNIGIWEEIKSQFIHGFETRKKALIKYREDKKKAGREWHCRHCP